MSRTSILGALALSSLLAAFLLSACGGTAALQSNFREAPIEIDGSEADWYGHLRPIEKEPASLGVVNDSEHLYISFLTVDETLVRRIMSMGLVVWLDPSGGKGKQLGIQYPLGLMNRGRDGQVVPMDRETMQDPEARRELFEASLQELDLLRGDSGERLRMSSSSVPGVAVRASLESGLFFYELRLPLREEGPFSIAAGVGPGEVLGIGIETGEIDTESVRRQMAERAADRMGTAGPGMGSGMGSGMGGPDGGMRGGGMMVMREPLKVWHRVTLAE